MYAIVVGIIAIVFGYLPVSMGLNVWLSLALGTVAIIALLRFYGKSVKNL